MDAVCSLKVDSILKLIILLKNSLSSRACFSKDLEYGRNHFYHKMDIWTDNKQSINFNWCRESWFLDNAILYNKTNSPKVCRSITAEPPDGIQWKLSHWIVLSLNHKNMPFNHLICIWRDIGKWNALRFCNSRDYRIHCFASIWRNFCNLVKNVHCIFSCGSGRQQECLSGLWPGFLLVNYKKQTQVLIGFYIPKKVMRKIFAKVFPSEFRAKTMY